MKVLKISNIALRNYCSFRLNYIVPNEYYNTFYLANATLLQIANYFIHSSYQFAFPELVKTVGERFNCSEDESATRVRNYINQLDKCETIIDIHVPLKRYHGGVDIVKANRVYHALSFHEKTLGGLRFDPELIRYNSQGFAAQATYRNALFGLDLGGAAGGLKISPYVLEPEEIKQLLTNYMQRIPRFEKCTDIIEPDLATTLNEMDIIHNNRPLSSHLVAVGKSNSHGGYSRYYKSGGECAVACIQQFLDHTPTMNRIEMAGDLKEKTYIIEGLGNMGRQVANEMLNHGAKCIGIKEHDCTIYDQGGIHIKAVYKHFTKYGTIRGFSLKCREHDFDAILTQPCDILILAAMQRSVSCNIADKIKAKIVVEVANMSITPTAYKVLIGKKVLVIPGILAGAGQTIVSYLEHQMTEESKVEPANIPILFKASIQSTVEDIIQIEDTMKLKLNFLCASYVRAIRNLFKRIIDKQIGNEKPNEKQIDLQS